MFWSKSLVLVTKRFFSSCLQRSDTCFVHQNSSLEFKSGKAFVTFALRTPVRAPIAILYYGQWALDKPDLILKNPSKIKMIKNHPVTERVWTMVGVTYRSSSCRPSTSKIPPPPPPVSAFTFTFIEDPPSPSACECCHSILIHFHKFDENSVRLWGVWGLRDCSSSWWHSLFPPGCAGISSKPASAHFPRQGVLQRTLQAASQAGADTNARRGTQGRLDSVLRCFVPSLLRFLPICLNHITTLRTHIYAIVKRMSKQRQHEKGKKRQHRQNIDLFEW